MILGIFGGLLQVGGIERIAQHTAAVLTEIAAQRDEPCVILGLNDPPGLHTSTVDDLAFVSRGYGRKKWRFAARVLADARRVRIAYIGHPQMAPLGWLLRRINRKAQYWVATYGAEVWQPLPSLSRKALRASDRITALSQFTADALSQTQGVDPRRVVLIPPALDPEFLASQTNGQSEPVPTPRKTLLTVGRLLSSEPGKGVDSVLRALPMVLQAHPETRYVVVGDGDQRASLERLAQQLGVFENVLFTGEQTGKELAASFERASVFVMPSRQEGFGIVFLEAMALGKPIIGGKHGGTPEVIEDGVTGYLVEHGDIETLVRRLNDLLSDAGLSKQMGDAGRQRVQQQYTFKHFRKRLADSLT